MPSLVDRIKAQAGTSAGSPLLERIKVEGFGVDPQEEVQGGLRFKLQLFGDTPEERRATFKEAFPEGDLFELSGGDGAPQGPIYRTKPGEKFKRLDEDMARTWHRIITGESPGRGFREMGADVAEFLAPDVPELVAETAMAILTKGRSLLQRMGFVTVAGGAAETAQQLSQTVAGSQKDSIGEQVNRALGATAWAAVGQGGGEGVTALLNYRRKIGLLRLQKPGLKAAAAGKRLKVELMPHQVSDVPFITRLANQARAVLPRVARFQAAQAARVQRALKGFIDHSARSRFIKEAGKSYYEGQRAVKEMVLSWGRFSPTYSGRAVRDGIRMWDEAAGKDVNLAHTIARRIWRDLPEEARPRFDGTGILRVVDELEQGTKGPLKPDINMRASDEMGFPVHQGPTQINLAPLDADLQRILGDLKRLDYSKFEGPDQLAALERQLHDLMLAPIEGARQPQKNASKVFAAIRNTLDNPSGSSPEAVSAWKNARAMAAARFKTREQLSAINIAVNPQIVPKESARALAQRLVAPGQNEAILLVRELLQKKAPGKWIAFREAAKTQLLDEGPHKALARFDDETLHALLDPAELRVFKAAAAQTQRLESTGIKTAMDNQATIRGFAKELFNTNKTESIDAMFELVQRSGGKDSPVGKSFQAAIIDHIHEAVETVFKGEGSLDATGLREILKEFSDKGLLKFLNGGQKRMLADVRKVTDFMRGMGDVGASMHGAEASRGMTQLKFSAFRIILENVTLGRLLTTNFGRRLLTGSGGQGRKFYPTVRMITLAANEIATDTENNKATGEAINELAQDIAGIPVEALDWARQFGRGE